VPIAFVNSGGATNAGGSTTIVSPVLACSAGNTIIVGVSSYTFGGKRTVSGITDSAGNSYSRCGSAEGGDANHGQEVWVASNISAHAANAITVTFSASATYRVVAVTQYSGLAALNVFDAAGAGQLSPVGTSFVTNAATTTQADELCVGFYINWDSAPASLSASAPNTIRYAAAGDAAIVDRIVSATGSYSVTLNSPTNSQYYHQLRTFKGAAAAGYTETLASIIGSLASAQERQDYTQTASTLIASGASAAAVLDMIEAVVSLGQEQGSAGAAQDYRDQGATVIVSESLAAEQLSGAAETLLSVAVSAAQVDAAQAYVDTVATLAAGVGSQADLAQRLDHIGTVAASITTLQDRRHLLDNLAIIALATASVGEIAAYLEQVASVAAGSGSLSDVLVGQFVGQYIHIDLAPARSFQDLAAGRSFADWAAPRSFTDLARRRRH